MASSWFIRGGGKVYGPLDSAKLKQLVAEGKINQSTEIAQSQVGPWLPASRVRGLFDAPVHTPPPAPQQQRQAYSPPAPMSPVADDPPVAPIVNVARRPISARFSKSNNGTIILVAGLSSLASLVLGYFAGREHVKYQIKQAFTDAGTKIARDFQQGMREALPGAAAAAKQAEQKATPVAKLKVGQAYDCPGASIALTGVRIDHPILKSGIYNSTSKHEEECLLITLTIRNTDARKQLKLKAGTPFGGGVFTMADDVGNDVDTMFFSSPMSDFHIVGSHQTYDEINPGQVVEHIVAFHRPLPKTKSLSFLVDKRFIGQDGVVQYEIPITAVDGFSAQ